MVAEGIAEDCRDLLAQLDLVVEDMKVATARGMSAAKPAQTSRTCS